MTYTTLRQVVWQKCLLQASALLVLAIYLVPGVQCKPVDISTNDVETQATVLDVSGLFERGVNETHLLFQRDDTDPYGTNDDAPGFGTAGNGGFGLTGAETALTIPTLQPVAPAGSGSCTYDYKSVLSASGAKLARSNGAFDPNDVKQGGVGDCGFGAALLALRGNGEVASVAKALVLTSSNPVRLRARFYATGAALNVPIDDELPQVNENTCTRKLASFQGQNNIYFVPLLEKAWAKYVDAYPQFRFPERDKEGLIGYPGLRTMPPQNVMRGITGRKRLGVSHTKAGFDQKFANAVVKCVNGPQTCAFVTPKQDTMAAVLGKKNSQGKYVTDAGTATIHGDHTFNFVDKDRGNKVVTIVNGHWYALMRDRSPTVKGTQAYNNPSNAVITMRNPWGCNPNATRTIDCAIPGGEVQISLRALWTIYIGLDTTTT